MIAIDDFNCLEWLGDESGGDKKYTSAGNKRDARRFAIEIRDLIKKYPGLAFNEIVGILEFIKYAIQMKAFMSAQGEDDEGL